MASLAELAPKLLNFDQDLDITLLDNVVWCMYSGSGEQVWKAKSFYENISHYTSSLNAEAWWTWQYLLVVAIYMVIQAACLGLPEKLLFRSPSFDTWDLVFPMRQSHCSFNLPLNSFFKRLSCNCNLMYNVYHLLDIFTDIGALHLLLIIYWFFFDP